MCVAKAAGLGEHEEREKEEPVSLNELLYENDFFKRDFIFFGAVLGSQQNWAEGTEISHIPPTPTYAPASPIITIPHLSGTFLIVDEAAWHIIMTESP